LPSARSQGSLAVMLTALTPAPARRTHHPLDQQAQQTACEHPVDLRERLPYRHGCPRLPAQGGTAASPGTAHLPCPPRPAPSRSRRTTATTASRPSIPRTGGSPRLDSPIYKQSGLLLEHTFRLFKQTLGWTAPKIRDPRAADRWTWLIIAAHTQLRLARPPPTCAAPGKGKRTARYCGTLSRPGSTYSSLAITTSSATWLHARALLQGTIAGGDGAGLHRGPPSAPGGRSGHRADALLREAASLPPCSLSWGPGWLKAARPGEILASDSLVWLMPRASRSV